MQDASRDSQLTERRRSGGVRERMEGRVTAKQLPSQMPEWDRYSKILDIIPSERRTRRYGAEGREGTREGGRVREA